MALCSDSVHGTLATQNRRQLGRALEELAEGLLMREPVGLQTHAAQAFYACYWGAGVFIQPYLSVLWRAGLGFSGSQVGILSFIRPLIAAPSGQLLSALADAQQVHRWVLLAAFAVALLCRGGMAFASSFGAHVLLVLLSEAGNSPVVVLTDASVAAASTDDAGFGRCRLFASLSWGILAPVTGWVLGSHGMRTNILCYAALGLAAAAPIWLLPLEALAAKASTADAAAAALPEARSAGQVAGSREASLAANQTLQKSFDSDLLREDGVKAKSGVDSKGAGDVSQHKIDVGAGAGLEEDEHSALAMQRQGLGRDLEAGRWQGHHIGNRVPGAKGWIIPASSEGPRSLSHPWTGHTMHMDTTDKNVGAALQPMNSQHRTVGAAGSVGEAGARVKSFQSPVTNSGPFNTALHSTPLSGGSNKALGCPGSLSPAATGSLAPPSHTLAAGPHHGQQTPSAASCSGSKVQHSSCQAVNSSTAAGEGFGRRGRRHSDSDEWAARPTLMSKALASLRQHSVTVALLPGNRKYRLLPLHESLESAEDWPGGREPFQLDTPRHGVGRTLSTLGSHSARAAQSMARSLNTLWAAGSVSGMGLPESAATSLAPRQLAGAVTAALSGPCRPEGAPLLEDGLAGGATGTHPSQVAPPTDSSGSEVSEASESRPESGDVLAIARAPSALYVDTLGEGHSAADEATILRSPTDLRAAVSGSPRAQARPQSANLSAECLSSLMPAHAPNLELRRRPSSRQVASPGMLPALRQRAQQPHHDAAEAGHGASGVHCESTIEEADGPGRGRPTSAPATLPGLSASSPAHASPFGQAQPPTIAHIASHTTTSSSSSPWRGIGQQLRDPAVLAFYSLAFLFGLGNGCIGYLMLYLRELGAPGLLLGLCLTANCCGEVPAFYFSGWWLRKLGPQRALNFVVLGFVIRLGAYLLLPHLSSLWWVLAVEVFQGLTFAGAMAAGTANCKRIAAPHLRSTTQAVFSSLYFGLGPALSRLAGGYMYAAWGLRSVFLVGLVMVMAGWACITTALALSIRRSKATAGASHYSPARDARLHKREQHARHAAQAAKFKTQ